MCHQTGYLAQRHAKNMNVAQHTPVTGPPLRRAEEVVELVGLLIPLTIP
jgi:hypothetical protein